MGYEAPELTKADVLAEINKLLTCTTNKITDAVVAHIDVDISSVGGPVMTPQVFSDVTATGDMSNPTRINDGLYAEGVDGIGVNKYIELDFVTPHRINQYRLYEHASCANGNKVKLQYWDGTGWVDWFTDVALDSGNAWLAWVTGFTIITSKIRIICTTWVDPLYFVEMSLQLKEA